MIRFTCLCRNRIEAADEQAGGMVQCTKCGRLNDVPTLSDLPHLSDDGTYNVDVPRPKDNPIRLAELSIIYSKGTSDLDGDVIDLRMTAAELAEPDSTDPTDDEGTIPLKNEPRPRAGALPARPAPRYDPETGELIVPVELKEDPDQPLSADAIPMARATIGYATGAAAHRVSWARTSIELLMPVNVVVMGFIFITHLLLQFTGTIVMSGFWLIVIAPLMLAGIIISHYGNVIDETGPQERDEMPRPLRSCGLFDDLWDPFVNVVAAFAICFGPAVVVFLRLPGSVPTSLAISGLLVVAGVVALPGVLLTTNTSGTIMNLRPDRFVGMVRACGSDYIWAMFTGLLATAAYGFGIVAADLTFIRLLSGKSFLSEWVYVVGYPMLALGIYSAHLFCWHLGLLYREHHAKFPWILQRHVRDPMKKSTASPVRTGRLRNPPPGAVGGDNAVPLIAMDTKTKLRELRALERKRLAREAATEKTAARRSADVPE